MSLSLQRSGPENRSPARTLPELKSSASSGAMAGRHGPAALSTTPTRLHAIGHVADALAILGALLADIGALRANALVLRRVDQHEMGGGPADFGTG
jgi:hypothetical protein